MAARCAAGGRRATKAAARYPADTYLPEHDQRLVVYSAEPGSRAHRALRRLSEVRPPESTAQPA